MAAIAPDVMTATAPSIGRRDGDGDGGQLTFPPAAAPASTPFPTVSEAPEYSSTSSSEALEGADTQNTSLGSSSLPKSRGILICTGPVIEITPDPSGEKQELSEESGFTSPASSVSESQELDGDDSSRVTLSSGASSSASEIDSTSSSTRTWATTLSSQSTGPCVSFAPLPEIGPRQRKCSRPIGLAARGQMLRQRRMMMAQPRVEYYYDEEASSIPGGERIVRQVGDGGNDRSRRPNSDEIAGLGKLLGDATKIIWRRMAHAKSKTDSEPDSASKPPRKRPEAKRTFTWSGRVRSVSIADYTSEDDSEDDADGPWRKRRDEDPMTKTIREGSDDGHGIEQFVLAYETIPSCEEEEEEHANARADEEMRTTVEVHLVNAAEGESDD